MYRIHFCLLLVLAVLIQALAAPSVLEKREADPHKRKFKFHGRPHKFGSWGGGGGGGWGGGYYPGGGGYHHGGGGGHSQAHAFSHSFSGPFGSYSSSGSYASSRAGHY